MKKMTELEIWIVSIVVTIIAVPFWIGFYLYGKHKGISIGRKSVLGFAPRHNDELKRSDGIFVFKEDYFENISDENDRVYIAPEDTP